VAVYNQTGNILGLLVGLVLSPLLFPAIGFSKMAILYALFGGCFYLVSLFFNREGRISGDHPHSVILQTLRSILVDRVFWLYALMMILTFFSTGLIPFALPFYVKYSLQAKSETISLLSGLALLASLLSMPVWSKLIKTWTLGRVFLTTASVSGIGMLGLGISPNLPCAAICAVVFGGALQGINVCNIVIRAGLITRNIDRTGNRNEASYYGLMNSALRIGGLLQSLAMFLVGMLFGYISGDQPGPQPDLAFRFLISFLPILSLCAAILIAIKFFTAWTSVRPGLQSNSAR
jgi:GPH family glycoside/pentoside/hexuronide:cation symporter